MANRFNLEKALNLLAEMGAVPEYRSNSHAWWVRSQANSYPYLGVREVSGPDLVAVVKEALERRKTVTMEAVKHFSDERDKMYALSQKMTNLGIKAWKDDDVPA